MRVITGQLKIRVWNETRNSVLATEAEVADSSKKRRIGLRKHQVLEPGQGLWLYPCEAVHCFGMKFSIDVLHLDSAKKVRKIRARLKPWRISFCLPGKSVLELPAGTVARTQTEPGDQLVFEKL